MHNNYRPKFFYFCLLSFSRYDILYQTLSTLGAKAFKSPPVGHLIPGFRGKSFPKIWVDYYREISSCLYSSPSFFLVFFPQFSPLIFYILFNLIYLSGSGSSSWSFHSIFLCSIFLSILSSPIQITCTNHLNLLF